LCCLRRQLKFLGIFNCDNASNFRQIPAEYVNFFIFVFAFIFFFKVCGDSGEQQLLLALQVYKQRPKIMQSVLNESYQLYRFGDNLVRLVLKNDTFKKLKIVCGIFVRFWLVFSLPKYKWAHACTRGGAVPPKFVVLSDQFVFDRHSYLASDQFVFDQLASPPPCLCMYEWAHYFFLNS
jgi:hypothetical protein